MVKPDHTDGEEPRQLDDCPEGPDHDNEHRLGWVVDPAGIDAHAGKVCRDCGAVVMTAETKQSYEELRAQERTNPDKDVFRGLVNSTCPEGEPGTGHSTDFELVDDREAVRADCADCGETLANWDTLEKFKPIVTANAVGECPGCGDIAWTNPVAGYSIEGNVWHSECYYKDQHGFEDTGGDAPETNVAPRPFALHRTVETDIGGTVFEWDEYIEATGEWDRAAHNLPSREELTRYELAELRDWAVGDNPTGDVPDNHTVPSVGGFPARFVLLGGHDRAVSDIWICPRCGELVDVKVGDAGKSMGRFIDLEAECGNCGSTHWVTRGTPVGDGTQEALEPLSDRERQVVALDMLGHHTDESIGDAFGVKPSTVREYRERAKAKAERGKRLYDKMDAFDLL